MKKQIVFLVSGPAGEDEVLKIVEAAEAAETVSVTLVAEKSDFRVVQRPEPYATFRGEVIPDSGGGRSKEYLYPVRELERQLRLDWGMTVEMAETPSFSIESCFGRTPEFFPTIRQMVERQSGKEFLVLAAASVPLAAVGFCQKAVVSDRWWDF